MNTALLGDTLPLPAFIGAATLLILAPGPDNLMAIAFACRDGLRASFLFILGIAAGLALHTLLVVSGAAIILQQSDTALRVLQSLGAIYLAYLAWQLLRQQHSPSNQQAQPEIVQPRAGSLFWKGLVMNASNPKVALFFLAFLPQFVVANAEQAHWQLITLGLVFTLLAIFWFGILALLANRFVRALPNKFTRLGAWIRFLLAGVLFAFSLRMLFWSP